MKKKIFPNTFQQNYAPIPCVDDKLSFEKNRDSILSYRILLDQAKIDPTWRIKSKFEIRLHSPFYMILRHYQTALYYQIMAHFDTIMNAYESRKYWLLSLKIS